jgi:hemolysin III
VFYAWHSLRHHHAIWHLWVMAGSLCHFFAVLWHVIPGRG